MGTLVEPLPVTGSAANFLPTPRMALPLLGRDRGVQCPDCRVRRSGHFCQRCSAMLTLHSLRLRRLFAVDVPAAKASLSRCLSLLISSVISRAKTFGARLK